MALKKLLIPSTGKNIRETINLKNFFNGLSLKCFPYERFKAELIMVIRKEAIPIITMPINTWEVILEFSYES